MLRCAQVYADELVALTELRDRVPRQGHLQEIRDVLRGHIQLACTSLIHFEMNRALCGLVPVKLDVGRVRITAHDLRHLPGYPLYSADLGSTDPELHRKA